MKWSIACVFVFFGRWVPQTERRGGMCLGHQGGAGGASSGTEVSDSCLEGALVTPERPFALSLLLHNRQKIPAHSTWITLESEYNLTYS